MGANLHEVMRPDMVGPFRAETDAGTVAWPDLAALWLPGRDIQPLLPPLPFAPLVVDHLAQSVPQHGSSLPVAKGKAAVNVAKL